MKQDALPFAGAAPAADDSRNTPLRPYASTIDELHSIVTHPAFRLGFLDRLRGAPLAHDEIARRIAAETPSSVTPHWIRVPSLWDGDDVRLAQIRYEEGRLLVVSGKCACRSWSHPDYPPKSVRDYIRARARGDADPIAPGGGR